MLKIDSFQVLKVCYRKIVYFILMEYIPYKMMGGKGIMELKSFVAFAETDVLTCVVFVGKDR